MSSATPPAGELTLIYRPQSIVEVLPLQSLFPAEQPLHVEIGAGDGSFFVAFAQAHPELNFIALERLLGRLRKIDRKCRRAGLTNVALLRMEADYFVRYLLPPESVEAIHIYFPDPWPKRRHWKNRLINEAFPNTLRRVLRPNGTVYLRTDNREYFEQMLASFDPNPSYIKIETPESILQHKTDFERNFNKAGIPTLHSAYQMAGTKHETPLSSARTETRGESKRLPAVVFDLGKVLLDFDYSVAARNIAAHCTLSADEIGRLINQSPLLYRYETGLMSKSEFYEEVKRHSNFVKACEDFEPLFADIFTPIAEMIELNEQLRARGIPTFIFSNTNPAAVDHIRRKYPFFKNFTAFVLSYEHGAMKPTPSIYEVVEKVTGLSGADILYLDDRLENVEAGAARGWRTIHHSDPRTSIARIEELGLLQMS